MNHPLLCPREHCHLRFLSLRQVLILDDYHLRLQNYRLACCLHWIGYLALEYHLLWSCLRFQNPRLILLNFLHSLHLLILLLLPRLMSLPILLQMILLRRTLLTPLLLILLYLQTLLRILLRILLQILPLQTPLQIQIRILLPLRLLRYPQIQQNIQPMFL